MSNLIKTRPKDTQKTPRKHHKSVKYLLTTLLTLFLIPCLTAFAEGEVSINVDGSEVDIIEIIMLMTILVLLPSILIMTTCFTRIIIVLSFLRNALGLQQSPPNQVLIGIALFLTLFIMSPVISQVDTDAYQPYKNKEITRQEFLDKAAVPMKEFMLSNTKTSDLDLFVDMSDTDVSSIGEDTDLPITVIIPAFMTSELKRAFLIGFLLYIPFLLIDMIVSSTLMSMGMVMLPPTIISLPFKILLFVLVDGWALLFKTLASSFNL